MSNTPELDKLLNEVDRLKETLRRTYQAGINAGIKIGKRLEQERVAKALGLVPASGGALSTLTRLDDDDGEEQAIKTLATTLEYGAIAAPVRNGLRIAGDVPEGIGAQELTDYIRHWPSSAGIEVAQVRTALKVLARRGEAIRLTRGKYRPSAALLAAGAHAAAPVPSHGVIDLN
jgi:hypothetical protein